jgi:chromosome segregation ATPase
MENRSPDNYDIFNIINLLRDKIENCLVQLHNVEIKLTNSENNINTKLQDKLNSLDKQLSDEIHNSETLKMNLSNNKQSLLESIQELEDELKNCKIRIDTNENNIVKINTFIKPFSKWFWCIVSSIGTITITILIALIKGWLELK